MDIVRRRLAATFGDRAALAVEAASDAYRVSVTLPIEPGVDGGRDGREEAGR
jgi:hypothetical protein